MPVDDAERLKKLNSDVLFIFPEKDQWINAAVVSTFQSNIKIAGREVEVLAFDADHAFANPSSEKYVEEAAQKANAATLAYLRERLK
ncbi:MAG: carboxymethylenebutenolidase [Vicingaceae bacterium]|jgi:carboxymethylenebutenolidase